MAQGYTAEQVYDSLIRQGFGKDQARIMAMAIGSGRVKQNQLREGYKKVGVQGAKLPKGSDGQMDSNLAPNLAEASAGVGGYLAAQKHMPPGTGALKTVGRWMAPGIAGSLAGIGTAVLTGNNYYDRASDGQLYADIGGSVAGGIGGQMLGEKYGKQAQQKIAAKAGGASSKQLGKRLVGKAAGSLVGRGLGSVLGAAGGPVGSIALGTALGYLLPKLIGGGSKSVEQEAKRHRNMYEDPFDE